jgi:hypothetical protein
MDQGRRHEFMDGVEDDLEPRILPALESFQPSGQSFMRRQQLTQSDEGTHDLDIHLDGAPAPQHGREHCDTLFGEGVRKLAPAAVATPSS